MVDKPDRFPDWATEEQVDPISEQVNRTEPPEFQKESGWTRREIPPRQWWNWTLWTIGRWIRWAEDRIEGLQYADEAEALAGEAEDRVIAPARFGDQSLTTDGYQVLPGGLIIQWGSGFANEANTINFPIAFPNNSFSVTAADTGSTPHIITINSSSDTSFDVLIFNTSGNPASTGFNWIAVGS